MGLRIQTNVNALFAQRQMSKTAIAFARTMQRLASGSRVNSARDGAAEISISAGIESQIRGIRQAVRNVNDAFGFLQTAEGAISTQTNLVQRMKELALQSANGTLSNQDRGYLNREVQQLLEEFNRLTSQTEFNGVRLLDGSFGTKALQIGAKAGQSISLSMPNLSSSGVFVQRATVGTGTFQTATSLSTGTGNGPTSVSSADVNNDGYMDVLVGEFNASKVAVFLGNGNGTFKSRTEYAVDTGPRKVKTYDLNGDGFLDIVTPNLQSNTVSILLGNGDGTFKAKSDVTVNTSGPGDGEIGNVFMVDLNGDSKLDLVSNGTSDGYISVHLGNGNGTFGSDIGFTPTNGLSYGFTTADIDSDGILDLVDAQGSVWRGNGDGTFVDVGENFDAGGGGYNIVSGDLNGDGRDDLISPDFGSAVGVVLITSGGFQAPVSYLSGATPHDAFLGDFNNDGKVDIATANLDSVGVHLLLGNGNGTFKAAGTVNMGAGAYNVYGADVNGDGVLDMISDDITGNRANVAIANTTVSSTAAAVTIATQSDAQNMLAVFSYALDQLASARSGIGALQSRLESTQSVNLTVLENLSAAKSQMIDADYAQEAAEMARLSVLQQAQASVFSQANLNLKLVLKLLE